MNPKHFAALLGFAFVAAWVAFGFGDAVLCLLGAGLFYGAAALAQGEIDLVRVQDRIQRTGGETSPSPAPAPPPRAGSPRVR